MAWLTSEGDQSLWEGTTIAYSNSWQERQLYDLFLKRKCSNATGLLLTPSGLVVPSGAVMPSEEPVSLSFFMQIHFASHCQEVFAADQVDPLHSKSVMTQLQLLLPKPGTKLPFTSGILLCVKLQTRVPLVLSSGSIMLIPRVEGL